jgi:hypothetical protein
MITVERTKNISKDLEGDIKHKEEPEEIRGTKEKLEKYFQVEKIYIQEFSKNPPKNYVRFDDRFDEIVDLIKKTVSKEDMKTAKDEIISNQERGFENISKILQENEELKKILNEKYSVKTLFIFSALASVFLIFSILVWFLAHTPLIHPAISIPLLIGSISFTSLSFWRMKTS